MRLTFPELLFVWLGALVCGAFAIGALREFGSTRAGNGVAIMCALFGYGLITRHLAAVLLSLLVALVGLGIAALCVVAGTVSYGLIGVAGATLYLLVVGRAALRELKWWDGERGL